MSLSDALTDLVHRLSEQLQQEANGVVAEMDARFKTEQTQLTAALSAQRDESSRFAIALQHAEVALSAEREAHEANSSRTGRSATLAG